MLERKTCFEVPFATEREITFAPEPSPLRSTEKSVAAYRAGIKTVIIPKANVPDLDDVPETVKENIKFVPVSGMDEVLKEALLKKKITGFKLPCEEEKKEVCL